MRKKPKHVWIAQCVRIIIFSIILLCTVFIPFSFADSGMIFSYTKLPLIGDASIANNIILVTKSLQSLTGLSTDIMIYISYVYEYYLYAFYGILLLDIVFALLLVITKLNLLRVIFRIIAILCGFVMIAVMVANIGYIVAYIYSILSVGDFNNLLPVIQENGLLYALVLSIFSGIMIKKQFSWFEADAI